VVLTPFERVARGYCDFKKPRRAARAKTTAPQRRASVSAAMTLGDQPKSARELAAISSSSLRWVQRPFLRNPSSQRNSVHLAESIG
jgi:hypothetical protein